MYYVHPHCILIYPMVLYVLCTSHCILMYPMVLHVLYKSDCILMYPMVLDVLCTSDCILMYPMVLHVLYKSHCILMYPMVLDVLYILLYPHVPYGIACTCVEKGYCISRFWRRTWRICLDPLVPAPGYLVQIQDWASHFTKDTLLLILPKSEPGQLQKN